MDIGHVFACVLLDALDKILDNWLDPTVILFGTGFYVFEEGERESQDLK